MLFETNMQDKNDMDYFWTTCLTHVMLSSSTGMGMFLWGEISGEGDLVGGLMVGIILAFYFIGSVFFSFFISMILGPKFESLKYNLISGSGGNALGVFLSCFCLMIIAAIDGASLIDLLEGYFKELFLGMSIAVALAGLAGAYIGGIGKTTQLPRFPQQSGLTRAYLRQQIKQQQMMMRQPQIVQPPMPAQHVAQPPMPAQHVAQPPMPAQYVAQPPQVNQTNNLPPPPK